MADAFKDPFTTSRGSSYFVSVEPSFVEQVTELANALARAQPAEQRQQYVSEIVTRANKAAPAAAAEPEEEEEGGAAAEEEAEQPVRSEDRQQQKELVSHITETLPTKVELNDVEFVGLTNLILSMLVSFELAQLVPRLVAFITASNSQASPSLSARYIAITNIINAASSTAEKIQALDALVSYAAANDDASVLVPLLRQLPALLKEWDMAVGSPDESKGHELVDSLASKVDSKLQRKDFAAFLAAHLATPSTDAAAVPLYRRLIGAYLSSPASIALPALPKQLSDPSFELLTLVRSGSLATYQSFASSHDALVRTELGLAPAELEKRIRLAGLADLCSSRLGTSVTYDEIRSALELPPSTDDEDVEGWVIDAIRSTLLAGRLSQPTRSFQITRASTREFSKAHWQELEQRLDGWKAAVDSIRQSTNAAIGATTASSTSTKEGLTNGISATANATATSA